jgi:hypothetical protein
MRAWKIGTIIGAIIGFVQLIGGDNFELVFVRMVFLVPLLGVFLSIALYRVVKENYIYEVMVASFIGFVVFTLFDSISFILGRFATDSLENFISVVRWNLQFIVISVLTAEILIFFNVLSRIKKKMEVVLSPLQKSAILGGVFGTVLYSYTIIYYEPEIINGDPTTSTVVVLLPYLTGIFPLLAYSLLTQFKKIKMTDALLIGLITWSLELAGFSIIEFLKLGGVLYWHYLGIILNSPGETVIPAVITALILNAFIIASNKIRNFKDR